MSTPKFDVFISHNSLEKYYVRHIVNRLLYLHNIRCWFDEWDLTAGRNWEGEITNAFNSCGSGAVILGEKGWGTYHLKEAQFALERAKTQSDFLVIPVLLPGAREQDMDELRDFFESRHRVDFRTGLEDAHSFQRFASAVRGEATGPQPMNLFVLKRDAERWHKTPQTDKPSMLYRGSELKEAQLLAAEYVENIGDLDKQFLISSEQEELRIIQRERNRTRRIIGGLSFALIVVAIAASIAIAQRSDAVKQRLLAEEQATIANEQRQLAETQTKVANEQRDEADKQRSEAKKQADIAEASRQAEAEQRKQAEIATKNERRARKGLEQQLLVTSAQALSTDALAGNVKPERAVLLAAEAVEKFQRVGQIPLPKAKYALMMAVSRAGTISLIGSGRSLVQAAISKNRRWLVASARPWKAESNKGQTDDSIIIWDLESSSPWESPIELRVGITAPQSPPADAVYLDTLVVGNTGKRIVAASKATGITYFWDLNRSKSALTLQSSMTPIESIELDYTERWLAVGSHLYDLESADATVNKLKESEHLPRNEFSPNGGLFVTWGPKKLACWRLPSMQPCGLTYAQSNDDEQISGVSLSSKENWIVAWINGDKRKALISKFDSLQASASWRVLNIHGFGEKDQIKIRDAVFSPDGSNLVIVGSFIINAVWDLRNGQTRIDPDGFVLGSQQSGTGDEVLSAEFSHNGKVLATSGFGIALWSVGNRFARPQVTFRAPTAPIVRFSPNDKWLISGGAVRNSFGGGNTQPWIWDLEAKDPEIDPIILKGAYDHGFAVTEHYFSSNSRWAISISTGPGPDLSIFPLELSDLILTAGQAVKRNFTRQEWDTLFPGEKYKETFSDSIFKSSKVPPFSKPLFQF